MCRLLLLAQWLGGWGVLLQVGQHWQRGLSWLLRALWLWQRLFLVMIVGLGVGLWVRVLGMVLWRQGLGWGLLGLLRHA